MPLDGQSRNPAPSRTAGNQVRLEGSPLCQRAHICAFFSNPDDEYRALLPFIKEGIDSGERAIHTVDPQRRKDHIDRLTAAGIDVGVLQQSGQLELHDWMAAHLRDGRFDLERTLELWESFTSDARRRGLPAARFVAHMEWALEPGISVVELLKYEAKANIAWMRNAGRANPVVCTYDITKFSAEVIIEVMRTHPAVIIGGLLQENPFFVPPEEYLQELQERHPRGTRRAA
jgi:hypothetical protein